MVHVWVGLHLALVLLSSWWPVGSRDHWRCGHGSRGGLGPCFWHKVPWRTFFLTSEPKSHKAVVG